MRDDAGHARGPEDAQGQPRGQHRAPRRLRRTVGVLALPMLLAGLITAGTPGWGSVVVQRGDTLGEIAARYGTSVSVLAQANSLPGHGNTVYAGQSLRVPTSASARRPSTGSRSPSRASRSSRSGRVYIMHRVVRGDTLIEIAQKYGAKRSHIRLANRLPVSGIVRLGQTLRVPVWRRATTSRPSRPGASARPKPSSSNTFAGRTYPDAVVAKAAYHRGKLSTRDLPSRTQMRSIIASTARKHGVSPSLALAIAYQESGFNPYVVSVADAIGAMQVIPSTGVWAGNVYGRPLNLLDPYDNAIAGVVLLRVLTRSADSLEQAIAGYYQGLAGVRRNGMYSDTKRYVANILRLRSQFA